MSQLLSPLRRRSIPALVGLALLVPFTVAPVVTSTASAAASSPTGVYSGKDSQGYKFSFMVEPANSEYCQYNRGTHAANRYCIYQANTAQVYVVLKCPGGLTGNSYLSLFAAPLGTNFAFSQTQKSYAGSAVSGVLSFHLTVAHGVAKGSFVQTQAPSDTSSKTWCTSGTVSFSLHKK